MTPKAEGGGGGLEEDGYVRVRALATKLDTIRNYSFSKLSIKS